MLLEPLRRLLGGPTKAEYLQAADLLYEYAVRAAELSGGLRAAHQRNARLARRLRASRQQHAHLRSKIAELEAAGPN